jgi:hypothetical protein
MGDENIILILEYYYMGMTGGGYTTDPIGNLGAK